MNHVTCAFSATVAAAAVLAVAGFAFAAKPTAAAMSALPAVEGVRQESFVYKKTPQGELSMIVSFPPGWKASDKRPAIVFFFGGGFVGGSVEQFAPQAAYLAGRGMVAARADYRVFSRHKATPDQCVEDARSAVRWMRANAAKLGIDADKLCASGGSAGGHLAIATACVRGVDANTDDKSISAVPNLLVLHNPVMDTTIYRGKIGSDEMARRLSPMHNITKDLPPAVFYYGADDKFYEPVKPLPARAAELKLDLAVYLAKGQSHGFFNRSPWLERTTYATDQFLTRHGYLTGEPTIKLPDGKIELEKVAK
jgi:acetyl esterase/lipase